MADSRIVKVFHLGDVLSVVTGHLVSPRYMDGVYDIIRYLTGSEPQGDAFSAAMANCRQYLISMFPQFDALDMESVEFENWRNWLLARQAEFGEWVEVRQPLAGC